MRIPSKLKIGAHTYKVGLIEGLDKNGSTDRETQTILIGKELPASQQALTLIYEIFHA